MDITNRFAPCVQPSLNGCLSLAGSLPMIKPRNTAPMLENICTGKRPDSLFFRKRDTYLLPVPKFSDGQTYDTDINDRRNALCSSHPPQSHLRIRQKNHPSRGRFVWRRKQRLVCDPRLDITHFLNDCLNKNQSQQNQQQSWCNSRNSSWLRSVRDWHGRFDVMASEDATCGGRDAGHGGRR